MKSTYFSIGGAAIALCATAGIAFADPSSCASVRLSDPGWTDITATNGVASVVLAGLGYSADISTLSVPIGYESIKGGQLDVFLATGCRRRRPLSKI